MPRTLADSLSDGSSLSTGRVDGLVRQLAAGLDAVHARSLVHGALDPSCVLIGEDGTAKLVGSRRPGRRRGSRASGRHLRAAGASLCGTRASARLTSGRLRRRLRARRDRRNPGAAAARCGTARRCHRRRPESAERAGEYPTLSQMRRFRGGARRDADCCRDARQRHAVDTSPRSVAAAPNTRRSGASGRPVPRAATAAYACAVRAQIDARTRAETRPEHRQRRTHRAMLPRASRCRRSTTSRAGPSQPCPVAA